MRELIERQIGEPDAESHAAPFVFDLTSLSSKEVGQIHSYWAGMLAFAIELAGGIETDLAGHKAMYAQTKDDFHKEEVARLTVQMKTAKANVDACKVLMGAASREISRRSAERAQTD